jgi:hypothetical protein
MKRLIIISAVAFITTSVMLAQNRENAQKINQNQKISEGVTDENKEAIRLHTRKHDRIHLSGETFTHGKNVSSLAQSIEPGKRKGEIIRQEARMQGKAQRTKAHLNGSAARNRYANMAMGARGNSLQHRNIRMYKGSGHGASRK